MNENWRTLPVSGRLFESARWLASEGCFQWVDILQPAMFRWFPGTDLLDRVEFDFEFLPLATPSNVSGVQFIASRTTVYTYRWGGAAQPLVTLPIGAGVRLNDGVVAPDGGLWVGSMALAPDPSRPRGHLWRVNEQGGFKQILNRVGISNGIVWIDKDHGFYVDSLYRRIDAVRFNGEELTRERLLTIDPPGEPDGLAIADGQVLVALWDAGEIIGFDLVTKRCANLTVPSVRPSSVAVSSNTLLVTTAGSGHGTNLSPTGSVIACELGPALAQLRARQRTLPEDSPRPSSNASQPPRTH